MNHTYRLIWNDLRQTWLVAHEAASARGKPSMARKRLACAALLAPLALGAFAAPPAPNTLPTGGQLVAGQATISQAGAAMSVQQATQQAILNWQSFSIGANASVKFQQPGASSVALNRVLGSDPSAIFGKLSANGQVFLVNPSGVLFGPGARVDVGGLVATTMNIRNEDFLARNYQFVREAGAGSVVNQGELNAKYVALLAPEVRNEGVIHTRMGSAALAAGERVTLGIAGERLIGVQVDKAQIDTLVENRHLIQAEDGMVILSAQSANALLGRVVNTGAIEATGIASDGGTVRLVASSSVEHSGRIDVDATQGAGAIGQGGSAILLADLSNPASRTSVSGSISARGGAAGGDGGFIETSASRLAIADSVRIDTSAANGRGGEWLLDPTDFIVALGGGGITGATLSTQLGTGNITIQSSGTGGGNGDVFVNDSVTWANNFVLTIQAHRNIEINAPITATGATSGVALVYDQAASGGDVFVRAPVNLPSTASFSTKMGAATADTYTVITTNAALAGIGSGLSGKYVLGADITATTNPWVPIGNDTTAFTGVFDGLGHRVANVTRPNNDNATSGIGLFGKSTGEIRNVGVTNVNVAGSVNVGGLVGINGGIIRNSYSTGTVTGSDKNSGTAQVGSIGGLVGRNDGNISNSYSSATVTASGATRGDQGTGGAENFTQGGIGGLAGSSQGPIVNSYATGSVTGHSDVGGLVGYTIGAIATSYSTGAVTGTNNAGGLVGFATFIPFAPPVLTDTYWDKDSSGQATSANQPPVPPDPPIDPGSPGQASTDLATADMKKQASFTGFNFTRDWVIREDSSYPLLRAFLPPLAVKADDKSKTYSNTVFGTGSYTATYNNTTKMAALNVAGLSLTGGTGDAAVNASAYTINASGVTLASQTDQHGFLDVTHLNGALVINPKVVSISGTRAHNGTANVASTIFSAPTGTVGAQTLGLTGTGTVPNKNVENGKVVTLGTLALTDGTGLASNYTLVGGTNTAEFTKADITISTSNVSKQYDGGTTASGTPTATVGTLFSGDSFSGGSFTFDNANVGANKTVTVTGVTVSDGNSGGNYNIVGYTNNTASSITKRVVNLSGTRVYDGTANVAAGIFSLGTLVGTETLVLAGAGTVIDKNVGDAKPVTVGSLALADGTLGGLASNYTLVDGTHVATITKAPLGITTSNVSKVYDGGFTASGTPVVSSGTLFSTDTLSGGTYAFTDKNAGTGKTVTVTPSTVTVNDNNSGGNYNVSVVNNTASTITARPVTVTADNKTQEQLTPNLALTYTVAPDGTGTSRGLAGSDALSGALVTGTATLSTGTAVSLGVFGTTDGTIGGPDATVNFPITQGTLINAANPNYTITFIPGTYRLNTINLNQGNGTVALANMGIISVGLRVFDSATFSLGADLITGDDTDASEPDDAAGTSNAQRPSGSTTARTTGSSDSSSAGGSGSLESTDSTRQWDSTLQKTLADSKSDQEAKGRTRGKVEHEPKAEPKSKPKAAQTGNEIGVRASRPPRTPDRSRIGVGVGVGGGDGDGQRLR